MQMRIGSETEYKREFPEHVRRRAYRLALDIRKFEIALYWKRATYFWALIAATFAGYFAIVAKGRHPTLQLLVACIGLVLSVSWYLVNRGSKYWQENWERHVDSLENDFAGPLYKTTIAREQFPFWALWGGYPFSVSKVNQLTSLFVVCVWLGLVGFRFSGFRPVAWLILYRQPAIVAFTVFFIGLLLVFGTTGFKERTVDFDNTILASAAIGSNGGNTTDIRNRLRELNTKAYYLLVALSFIYYRAGSDPSWLLKAALTLTAVVAVLPVQDRINDFRKLEIIRWSKVVALCGAFVLTVYWLWFVKA